MPAKIITLTHNGKTWASYREIKAQSVGGVWTIYTDEMPSVHVRSWVEADRGAVFRLA